MANLALHLGLTGKVKEGKYYLKWEPLTNSSYFPSRPFFCISFLNYFLLIPVPCSSYLIHHIMPFLVSLNSPNCSAHFRITLPPPILGSQSANWFKEMGGKIWNLSKDNKKIQISCLTWINSRKLLKLNESQEYKAKYLIGRNSYRSRPTSSNFLTSMQFLPSLFWAHCSQNILLLSGITHTRYPLVYLNSSRKYFFYKKQIHGSIWGGKSVCIVWVCLIMVIFILFLKNKI